MNEALLHGCALVPYHPCLIFLSFLDLLKSLTDLSCRDIIICFAAEDDNPCLSCEVQNEFKVISIFSFDNLHCTNVSTVLL